VLFNDPAELVGLLDVMLPKQCANKASGIVSFSANACSEPSEKDDAVTSMFAIKTHF
jgi:hypothetical protein